MKILMLAIGAALCLATGCSDKREAAVDGPEFLNSILSPGNGVLSDFRLGYQSYVTPGGNEAGQSVHIDLYHPDSNHGVSGGAITINGTMVPQWTMNGGTWYQNKGFWQGGALVLDGRFHVFNVPGAPGFPALIDSVRAPMGQAVITYPATTDTLSRSAGATIQWTPTGGVDGVMVHVKDTSTTIGSKMLVRNLEGNTGRLLLSPSELSQLKPGPLTVRVYCGNIKSGEASSGQRYRIIVFASQEVRAWLRN